MNANSPLIDYELRGLMEKAGRGSVLMVKQYREAGLPAPFWNSDPQLGVTVTFTASEVTPEVRHQATPQDTQQVRSLLMHMGTGNQTIRAPIFFGEVPDFEEILRSVGEFKERFNHGAAV